MDPGGERERESRVGAGAVPISLVGFKIHEKIITCSVLFCSSENKRRCVGWYIAAEK